MKTGRRGVDRLLEYLQAGKRIWEGESVSYGKSSKEKGNWSVGLRIKHAKGSRLIISGKKGLQGEGGKGPSHYSFYLRQR